MQAGPETFNTLQARVVGGTTWHWGGLALRYHPNDFVLKSKYGVGVDWPLAYTDIEPWYVEAENAIGVAGPADEDWDAPRSQGYPMPMVAPTYLDQVVAAACKTIGLTMAPFPQARNTIGRDGRPPCCGNASCVPICPIGAKYDGGMHVAKAEAAGARVMPLAVAHRVDRRRRRQGMPRSASCVRTAASRRRAARCSSSRRTRSRRRSSC